MKGEKVQILKGKIDKMIDTKINKRQYMNTFGRLDKIDDFEENINNHT